MSLDPSPFDPTELPFVQWVSVWDSNLLENGELSLSDRSTFVNGIEVEGSDPPPYSGNSQLWMLFLRLFASDDSVRRELLGITAIYSRSVDSEDVGEHLASWDYWECNQETLVNSASTSSEEVLCKVNGVTMHRMERPYVEAVLHLCARERMGPSWPRLIHGLVVTYLLAKGDPDGPSFEPFVTARMFGIQEGVIDGYHPIWSVMYPTQNGMVPVIAQGVSKRETLRRLRDNPSIQVYVLEHWDELKRWLKAASGYERRRTISSSGLDQIQWLFHRHILNYPIVQISAIANVGVTTAESAIKDLRLLLDLQPKRAIQCLDHSQRPPRLHTR